MIQVFISNTNFLIAKSVLKAGFQVENKTENISTNSEDKKEEKLEIENTVEEWSLEIPSIELKASIQEGTTKEIMDQFIGHFEETSKEFGNIGLAAHNRGYPKNYFENIKKLKEGDRIYYQYQGKKREYVVISNCIIEDTNWDYLENTEDNRITLITCVENEPQYRRCIQGKEREEI